MKLSFQNCLWQWHSLGVAAGEKILWREVFLDVGLDTDIDSFVSSAVDGER